MKFYDATLKQLYDMTAEQQRLKAKRKSLQAQAADYSARVEELRALHQTEQADVDKLEGRSLAAYFYNVIGKRDEKLDKERAEAYAAKVKLDAAEKELAAIQAELAQNRTRLAELYGCDTAYAQQLATKREEIKASATPTAAEILQMEEEIAHLQKQQAEIDEALAAGRQASGIADSILDELNSADSWNTWDMFGGGGLITHIAKHDHLDGAQAMVESLQSALRNFKTELADIDIRADMQVNVDGFLRFADYFFDGLFADWAVAEQISASYSAVQETASKIERTVDRLESMQQAAARRIASLESQTETMLLQDS